MCVCVCVCEYVAKRVRWPVDIEGSGSSTLRHSRPDRRPATMLRSVVLVAPLLLLAHSASAASEVEALPPLMESALDVVARASSSSEVLTLNLTNLIILLVLKVRIGDTSHAVDMICDSTHGSSLVIRVSRHPISERTIKFVTKDWC